MGAKTLDTKGIEFLEGSAFIPTPVGAAKVGRVASAKKAKPAKKPVNTLQGVSSWAILRELLSRHYVDMQVVGFWTVLAIIVWIKLGR